MADFSQGFGLTVTSDASGTTIRVRGECDIATAAQVGEALSAAAGQPGDRIMLDLSDVTFMDSSGLAVLVEHARLSMQDGDRLRLTMSPDVESLLDLSGLRAHFRGIETD